MDHSGAVDLGIRIQKETGYDYLVESIGQDLNGRYVRVQTGPGRYVTFYSPEAWERHKAEAGWMEQMQWRPQPGGEQL